MAETVVELRWGARLRDDRHRARRNQTSAQLSVTNEVVQRAMASDALAVALTGSTARAQRTAISDLDYHVVGPRPNLVGLPGDVDVVADPLERFQRRLVDGDDFIHWTLRYGCVLEDPYGVMRAAHERIQREDLWPDFAPKFERASALAGLAERVLAIEDRDAAQEHVRASLTSLARGLLLAAGTFPLARAELPAQLHVAGRHGLAEWLSRSIYDQLSLDELRDALVAVHSVEQLRAARP